MGEEMKEPIMAEVFLESQIGTDTAQQEIIRCKYCKWYEIYQLKKDGTDDRRYKPSYCANLAFHTSPDWFCADAERKEEEC